MSFIRTKKIKGAEYAYIVENVYQKRGKKTKQRPKKYLGRVYKIDQEKEVDFYEFYKIDDPQKYIKEHTKEKIIEDLLKIELINHGFKENKNLFIKEDFEVYLNIKSKKVYNKRGNDIALAFNQGYLTGHALRKIFNFKAEDEEDGYILAKMFVEAGIAIPQDIFVGIFHKVF